MKESNDIKLKRTESLLKELIPEAFASLSDDRINSITVTDVVCSKGKYDAIVYIYIPLGDKVEKERILRQLSKANGRLSSYILSSTNWFKCPKFTFKLDDSPEKGNKLDEIFKKISDGHK